MEQYKPDAIFVVTKTVVERPLSVQSVEKEFNL